MEQGLKLYRAHKQQAAVRKWKGALKNIRQREDKFALLGYLYQAYMDWGKYRYVNQNYLDTFVFEFLSKRLSLLRIRYLNILFPNRNNFSFQVISF